MTYQECIWKGKQVRLVSLCSKSGIVRLELASLAGMPGEVIKESKNGMLLVKFEHGWAGERSLLRTIPASCLKVMH